MKKIFCLFICLMMVVVGVMAQKADRIVGTYKVERNGVNSKVKITKNGNGYRAQVIWVENLKMPDGSIRTDVKNPDKSKRNVRADQIVLIDKVTYDADDEEWSGGKIYDPTNGKTYRVKLWFDSDKVLKMRGYVGIFYDTSEWYKIQ